MDAPELQTADDVLAQPTRARLFALLDELRRPAGTVELAERLKLHPNGVRLHLERMERAGLLQRAPATNRRGRPRDMWTISADAAPGGAPPRGYRDLGRWLARALRAQPAGVQSVEETGRQIGREQAPADAPHDLEVLMATLTSLGFQPAVEQRQPDGARLCLHNCPYADAVHENQPVVCALHRGMTEGLLEVVQPGAELVSFVARDPDEHRCEFEIRLARAEAG